MRISNYPTDVLTGSELILGTDVDTSTQTYKTVNFSVDTLKAFFDAGDAEGVTSIIFEGPGAADSHDGVLTSLAAGAEKTYTLPNATGFVALYTADPLGVTIASTPAELNILDGALLDVNELNILNGVTATTAEINVLDGIPAGLTATELGYVDGVTSSIQAQLDAKAAATDAGNHLDLTESGLQTIQGSIKIQNTLEVATFGITSSGTPASADAGDLVLRYDVDTTDTHGRVISWKNSHATGSDDAIAKMFAKTSDSSASNQHGGTLMFRTRRPGVGTYHQTSFGGSDGMWSFPGSLSCTSDSSITLGAGGDLVIEHDGSNSYIKQLGTGSLIIAGTDETLAKFTDNGSCELYHDNVKAVETVGATHVKGIKITGGIKMGSAVTSPSPVDLQSSQAFTMHEEAGAIGFLAPDAGLADGAKSAEITFTNLRIESGGAIVVATCNGAGDGAVIPIVYRTQAGSCRIKLWNQSGGTIANGTQILVNFAVINVNS
jgi:hypothetical protein